MPRYIASYDLNSTRSPHADFLEAAEKHGWHAWILGKDRKWYRLPNTTITGTFPSSDAAIAAFKAIKATAEESLGSAITVEKWIVVESQTTTFKSDTTVDE